MATESDDYQPLMRLALAGDGAAYAQLLRRSAQLVRPFLARYLKGNDEAQDVLQEVLLSVHKARHTYDGTRPFKPWLFAIAKFRLQDYLRRHYANRLRDSVDIADVENFLPAAVTESAPANEHLVEGLRQLPDKQARIIELMHGEGYTAKETAVKLGMKESAVKVAAHRAYKKLREKLKRP